MQPERWELIQSLFLAVADLDPVARSALLSEHGARDPPLRREVEKLLSAEGHAGGVWETSIRDAIAAAAGVFVGDAAAQRDFERSGPERGADCSQP